MSPEKEPPTPPAAPQYVLSVEEASEAFVTAGVARSPRTIIRYCAHGHLDCIKADTEQNEKYLITRESVDRRIDEIRQVAKLSHVSTKRDESRHDSSRRDTVEPGVDNSPELEKKIEELQAEVLDLKITNRGKDYFLKQLQDERRDLMDQVRVHSRKIGQLETRLKLEPRSAHLELPQAPSDEGDTPSSTLPEDVPRHHATEGDPAADIADAVADTDRHDQARPDSAS